MDDIKQKLKHYLGPIFEFELISKMKKDIHIPKVTNVAIAIVKEKEDWFAYLINNNNFSLENTLISSKGYGVIDSKPKKTTFFSHYLGTIDSMSYKKVELLNKDVFGLTNEFLLRSMLMILFMIKNISSYQNQ